MSGDAIASEVIVTRKGPSAPVFVEPARAQKSFISHAKAISGLTLVSRVLGLARETVSARYFGASGVISAFTIAFSVPNLFRKLLGEGALSSAFIPLYAQAVKAGDKEAASNFAAASVSLLGTILLALTVVGELVCAAILHAGHFEPDTVLILRLTQIMMPYVLLICGTAFLGGILQVHHRFALPAIAPVLLNVVHIGVMIIGARLLMLGRGPDPMKLEKQTRLAYWLAGFVLVAGIMQIGMLLPALASVGFGFRWVGSFWTPQVRKMLRLSMPVALSAGLLQLSVVIDKGITLYLSPYESSGPWLRFFRWRFAYPMAQGAVARLNWAQLIYQFPLGLFAIALSTAIFPTLSAEALDKDRTRFKASLRQGIIAALMEGLPASLGLILVRYPLIRIMLQHGKFTPADTRWVALSTIFFAAGIWAFSLQQIMNRAYYAMHDTVTPLMLSMLTIVVNTVVEVPLVFTRLGEAGMAAGTLASFAVQAVIMLVMLDRRAEGLGIRAILVAVAKMVAACGAMGLACLAVQRVPGWPRGESSLSSLAQLVILVCVGGLTYVLSCEMLGVKIKDVLPKHAR